MEATEIAEQIGGGHHAHEHHNSDALFRRFAGIFIGVVAMLLAITTLGGSHATKLMLTSNIHASDTYSFYQAKTIRQTLNNFAADQMEVLLQAQPDMAEATRKEIRGRVDRYRATAARYESEPATNDGKKELMAKAQALEAQRDLALRKDPNFEFAEALFQIAIVLGSVSIVAGSRPLLGIGGVVSCLATLLMLNGFFLFFDLPLSH